MDLHEKLDELTGIVEQARSMPMSASCVVNRGEVLELLAEVKALLPEEFRHAQMLLADRESVVDEGRREAQRLINLAEEQRLAMTSETEVVSEARRQAHRIRSDALEEAETMRREVDDYVDTKLANFEVVLEKTLGAVRRGREKVTGRGGTDTWEQGAVESGHPLGEDPDRR